MSALTRNQKSSSFSKVCIKNLISWKRQFWALDLYQDTQSEWHFKFVCKIHMAYLKSLPGKFLFCLEEQMCLKFIFCIFTSWGEFKRHHIPLLIFKTTPEVNTENKFFCYQKRLNFFLTMSTIFLCTVNILQLFWWF